MANLNGFLDVDKNNIQELIDEKHSVKSLPRPYLGMSQLGDECSRKLWFYFRWCGYSEYDGRVGRIFATGHEAEEKIIKDLESIGIETWDTLDSQAGFEAVSKHCQGHGDGMGRNIPGAEKTDHLLEFKTMSDKFFKEMKKKGVRAAKPVYYAQMILYMFFTGAKRALFVVINKNDSSYYFERVKSDSKKAKDLLRKAEDIITSENIDEFDKIGTGQPNFYLCRFCDYSKICHDKVKPPVTCRTCKSVSLLDDGKWGCGARGDEILSIADQEKACSQYVLLDCLR